MTNTDGPAPRQSWASARLCTRVEMACLTSDPVRPSVVLLILAAAVLSWMWWPTFAIVLPDWALICSILIGLLTGSLVCVGQQLATAWWGFARADRAWLTSRNGSRAAAYANQSRPGVWKIACVCADPRGRGAGAAMMGCIADEARQAGVGRLELVAASRRAAQFYRRCGYLAGRRTLFGRAMHQTIASEVADTKG